MLNYSGENRINVAASVEFIHNSTLLHDDVLDESEARHGVKTANKISGNKSSILVGDLLLTLAFRWLIECGNLNILSILSKASHLLVKGEIKQMTARFDPYTGRANYIDIIGEKTASLFSACCEAASTKSGATNDETERLKYFGFNFGMAFQIVTKLARNVIDSCDNLKRVMEILNDGDPVHEGLKVAYQKIINDLKKHGIEEVDPLGELFDSNLHQAVVEIEDNEKKLGTILEVLQTGYTIKNRLLRLAMVILSKKFRDCGSD